jgi:hypothetical protein
MTWISCISSSGHLWLALNREILDVAGLRLRFRSIDSAKPSLNLSAIFSSLFLRTA